MSTPTYTSTLREIRRHEPEVADRYMNGAPGIWGEVEIKPQSSIFSMFSARSGQFELDYDQIKKEYPHAREVIVRGSDDELILRIQLD